MSVSRRGFLGGLAGILAAGAAPLYVPNMNVCVPKELTPEELLWKIQNDAVAKVKELAAEIYNNGMVRRPATGTYHFDETGIVFTKPKTKFVLVPAMTLADIQPLAPARDLVFFQGPRPWLK